MSKYLDNYGNTVVCIACVRRSHAVHFTTPLMRSIQTATHPVIAGQRANAVFAPREPNGRRWQAKPRHDDFSGAYRYWVSGMRQGIQSWRRRSDGSVDGSHLSSLKHTRIPLPLLRFRTDGQWPATIIDRQRGGRHRPANSKYWVVESQASLS